MKKIIVIIFVFFTVFLFIISDFSFAMKSPYYPWEKTFTEEDYVKEEVFARLLENIKDSDLGCEVVVKKNGSIKIFLNFELTDKEHSLNNEIINYNVYISEGGEIIEESTNLGEENPELSKGINGISRDVVQNECVNDIKKLPKEVKTKIKKAFGINQGGEQ